MVNLNSEISGISVTPLNIIKDERGAVMHMIRSDEKLFEGFGEIYFSVVNNGAIKAWKRHRKMVQFLAVPVGCIRLVLYDDREKSLSNGVVKEIITGNGDDRYELIRIAPMIWYGFSGIAQPNSIIANCATLPHDITEVERLPYDTSMIPYQWENSECEQNHYLNK